MAAAGAGLALTGCTLPTFGAFHGATKQGQDALKLWQGFFIAGLAVFGLIFGLIVLAIVRYRRRSDDVPRQTQYRRGFEVLYTVVPIVAVFVLFAFTFVTENNVDALSAKAINIKVTAFQWGWQFQYPKYRIKIVGVETQDPEMVIPVGETVQISLVSNDVVHGFYVPEFNFSRYAQPGVTNHFDFDALHPGTYRGQCTQFCGLYHSLMIFQVKAVSPAAFRSWVHHMAGSTIGGSTAPIPQALT